ncbi:MAG: DUF4184 domain-containing protein [Arenicellales bacterium]
MPFTPLHFGPGLAIKAIAPVYFSFTVFVFSQVLIDIEPLYFMLNGEWPVHRYFHTYPGATVAGVASFVVGRPVCGICLSMFRRSLRISKSGLLEAMRLINPVAALSGAFIGSWSHVALDSIMHSDIRPFAPFVDDNMLLGSLTVYELHLFCVVAGIAGAVGMGFWWLVWQERR